MSSRRHLVFAAALLAAGCAAPARQPADDVARLTQLANAWDAAIVRQDRTAIAANMAEDFRQIDPAGDVFDKAAFVADIVAPELRIDPYTVEDFEIRLYGDTALLSGRTRMTGQYAGKPFSSHYRYIDVYVRRAGVWQIVSVQITKLAR